MPAKYPKRATTSQWGGKRAGAGRPKGSRNVKKKTARGAYKPGAKRQMAIRRRPFIETKRRIHSVISTINAQADGTEDPNYPIPFDRHVMSNSDCVLQIPLQSYTRMSQGFNEFNCIGDTVFSRSLHLKLEVDFPAGVNAIINPVRVFLICGWVTAPMALTAFTAITEDNATQDDVRNHIQQQCQQYFNQKEDWFRYPEKTHNNVKIDYYKSLLPNRNKAVAPLPATHVNAAGLAATITTGAVPYVRRSYTWKTNRKIHYTEGKAESTVNPAFGEPDTQNLFPNNQWVPFALLYSPDNKAGFKNQSGAEVNIGLRYNDIHYYSDS